MVALVINSQGKPRVVGQYERTSDGTRVWRIWDASATYDAETRTWSAVAMKDSRRINTNQAEQRAYSAHWILLAHLDDESNLIPPFFGQIGDE